MKKFTILVFLLGFYGFVVSQNIANRIFEYKPAPGQHINIESIGTPQAAQNMPVEVSNLVSLGSFGGYIVLGFEYACVNHPENPYGIDFTIFGNSFSGSSEPGVVYVMKDENQNGQPDDTWYEIWGSQHFHSATNENYIVTYKKTETRDIFWNDNLGKSGFLLANSFNTQEYYPTSGYFPDYPQDSVGFEGTLLAALTDNSNSEQLMNKSPHFGYADVRARKQGVSLTSPDNPYTEEIEGAGGDPIDISWAVGADGNYVDLDSIHFIKIATGNLASIGWLGEISTDVAYVAGVEPNSQLTGENKLLVVYHHQPKILVDESLQIEAKFFENGKPVDVAIDFLSENTNVATVNSTGLVFAENTGVVNISASFGGKTQISTITVVAPDSIEILTDFSSVYVGDTLLLEAHVFDNNGDLLNTGIQYLLETENAGKIIVAGGKSYFVAEKPGETAIRFQVEGFTEKRVNFQIHSENYVIRVYFMLKTENENLFPLQKIEVGMANLNASVNNRNKDYSTVNNPVLAYALIAGLQNAKTGFVFSDDENSDEKLYLYSLENNGEFTYGWGGKTTPQAFAKSWVACVNSNHFLNDFDKIEIADGDTIVLYHVSNITASWVYSRMISDKDSAKHGDLVGILLQQATCTFNGETIAESSLSPIIGNEIYASQTYFSDENGEVEILILSNLPLIISSGNDAVLIHEKIITSNSNFTVSDVKLYPNPAETELFVTGKNLDRKQMYIFDLNGKCIWSESGNMAGNIIDVQYFNPGVYVLKIVGGSDVETFKFIKK